MPQLSPTKFNAVNGRNYCFAGYPDAKIWKDENASGTSGWAQHLLFGDYVTIEDLEIKNGRVKVRSRNTKGWIKVDDIQRDRVLEINFIDIGQGDGCHVVTPDDQHFIIDAGETDNMVRYLVWRFNLYPTKVDEPPKPPFTFRVIISHCDDDHYGGFENIFKHSRIRVSDIYHNGLVQRPGEQNAFGTVVAGHVTTLVKTDAEMRTIINDPAKRTGTNSKYPKTLFGVFANSPNVVFEMLSSDNGFVPGFDASTTIHGQNCAMKILGPIIKMQGGTETLPFLKDVGKTKNGHSVLIRLDYGNARFLLGGDINEEAGKLMVKHLNDNGMTDELRVDVAKACHHGSNHFDLDFVKLVNAAATVISSGDEESFSHPRPDAIGALGRWGYGDRPMIFSTELARSNKEVSKKEIEAMGEKYRKRDELKPKLAALDAIATRTPEQEAQLKKIFEELKEINLAINSTLTKYGMINVRCDGQRMIVAQKLEIPAKYGKWDLHRLEFDPGTNRFELRKDDD